MKIQTNDLIDILNTLESELRANFPTEIDLKDDDFYWHIEDDDFCNPYKEIKDLDINLGQLSFDLDDLSKHKEQFSSFYLKKISVLLRIIGKNNFWISDGKIDK